MLKINELNRLYLGIQGENKQQTITIDVRAWLDMHPNGTISIWHKRNGDEVFSPTGATLDRDEAVLSWSPTNTDTYVSGEGVAEIRLTDNEVIKKSRAAVTGVSPSPTGAGTPLGSSWQDYIDVVEGFKNAAETAEENAEAAAVDAEDFAEDAEAWATGKRDGEDVGSSDPTYENNAKYYAGIAEDAKDDAETAKQYAEDAQTAAETAQGKAEDAQEAAEIAAGHGPQIDTVTGNWKTWDAADGQYEDTGVHAKGDQGDDYVLTTADKEEIAGLVSGMFVVEVSGATPSITGVDNHRYVCGTVSTISITPPSSGIIDVIFTAGSGCVLTLPVTVNMPAWFDDENLEQGTTYEINILDGVYGSVTSWA